VAVQPTEAPPTEVAVQPTEALPTETAVPPTETEAPPTEVAVQPTEALPAETAVPPTEALPTETAVPPTEALPTEVAVQPTEALPTETAVPPTETEVPPTETVVPMRTPRPTRTPIVVFTPTATPATEEPLVTLVQAEIPELEIVLDVPDGWTQVYDEESSDPEQGVGVVLFYSDPADVASLEDTPAAPALALLRLRLGEVLIFASPADVIAAFMSADREEIEPVFDLAVPAARWADLETEDGNLGVVYVLQLGDNDWLVIVLAVPPGGDLLALEEIIVIPAAQSVETIETAPSG
jgi:hypothetical protein